jgi:sulfatase modifying factor 1
MLQRGAMGALRSLFFLAALAVGCGGRTSVSTSLGAVSGSSGAGVTLGSDSGSTAVATGSSAGIASGAVSGSTFVGGSSAGVTLGASGSSTGICEAGCLCFSTPETCPTGCYPAHDSTGAFFCSNGPPIGIACASDSDCSGGLACAFEVASGCFAKGTCQALLMGGIPCPVQPACTCAGSTDPNPGCGLGGAHGQYAYEPIAYQGPCIDGGPIPSDAGTGAGTPPSCAPGGPGMTNCGPGGSGTESCCTSLEVAGGTYDRAYLSDADGGATGLADPATVSSFRLDKYLVTVGRFRQFVNAVLPPDGGAGWMPAAGSGKHVHLNDGKGLAATGGGYEPGWLATDDIYVVPTNANLAYSFLGYATWTDSAGTQENLPINSVNWYEAYAFCTWDGGFLPSGAEWEYAGAGGSQQREYPWGSTDPGTSNLYAIYGGFYWCPSCPGAATIVPPVGTAARGAGAWGQLDLTGELSVWVLDWYSQGYPDPCTDCAYANPPPLANKSRIFRGGDYSAMSPKGGLLPSDMGGQGIPSTRETYLGFRCARTP